MYLFIRVGEGLAHRFHQYLGYLSNGVIVFVRVYLPFI